MDRVTLLKNIQLFESLENDDLERLATRLEERRYEAGQSVFEQNDEGNAVFLIHEGAVDITLGQGKTQVIVASYYPGQYFGELSLLDGAPRSAGAVATKPTVLLTLEREDFVDFVKRDPAAALLIMHEIGERIRSTNELMTRTVSKNVLEEQEDQASFGDRIADKVASFGGSWSFIFLFGGIMLFWMIFNSLFKGIAFDPLPFMFLNLCLSTIAALQAPVIMMSQNRQASKDKAMAVNDFQVNLKNEIGIDKLLKGQAEVMQRLTLLEKAGIGGAAGLGGAASAAAAAAAATAAVAAAAAAAAKAGTTT
jgi:CRP/FNR family cyclic AMP-dependent transcriptional regulator